MLEDFERATNNEVLLMGTCRELTESVSDASCGYDLCRLFQRLQTRSNEQWYLLPHPGFGAGQGRKGVEASRKSSDLERDGPYLETIPDRTTQGRAAAWADGNEIDQWPVRERKSLIRVLIAAAVLPRKLPLNPGVGSSPLYFRAGVALPASQTGLSRSAVAFVGRSEKLL